MSKRTLYMVMGSLMVELTPEHDFGDRGGPQHVPDDPPYGRTVVSLLVDMGSIGMSVRSTGMCESSINMTSNSVGMVFGGGRSSLPK